MADLLDLQNTLYASANPMRRWLHRQRLEWITQALDQASGERGRALEIGPGSGIYLRALLDRYAEVTAVDIEDRFLDAARALATTHPQLDVRRADMTASDALAGEQYDLILCTEVIEHIPPETTAAAFATLRRALKPGGVLVLTTPQRWSTLEVVARLVLNPVVIGVARRVYREPVNELGHINLMTAGAVRHALASQGFEVARSGLLGLYLPVVGEVGGAWAVTLADKLQGWLKRSPLSWMLWTQCYVARPS